MQVGLRGLLGLLGVAMATGCEQGCEGDGGVAVLYADGSWASSPSSSDDGGDPDRFETRVCAGGTEEVIFTLYSGCGGSCPVESRVVSLLATGATVSVMTAAVPASSDPFVEAGHGMLLTAQGPTGATPTQLDVELEASDGDWRRSATLVVTVDDCPAVASPR